MSTNRRKSDFEILSPPLSMRELVAVLVKHYGLSEGKYDLGIEFQIGTGPVGPNKEQLVPGVILGVKSVGLAPSKEDGPTTVDAATLEIPARAPSAPAPKKSKPAKKIA